jgi:hypothetical protein
VKQNDKPIPERAVKADHLKPKGRSPWRQRKALCGIWPQNQGKTVWQLPILDLWQAELPSLIQS